MVQSTPSRFLIKSSRKGGSESEPYISMFVKFAQFRLNCLKRDFNRYARQTIIHQSRTPYHSLTKPVSRYSGRRKAEVEKAKAARIPSLFRTVVNMSTVSGSGDEGHVQSETLCDLDFDMENDCAVPVSFDSGTDHSSHLLTILYPGNPDAVLQSLVEATTLEEVFSIMESIPEDSWTPQQSSQAFATVWDLQKLAFQVGYIFEGGGDSSRKKVLFTQSLKRHPAFQKILNHILHNHTQLNDEALAACLFCLTKFDFSIRSDASQILLGELDSRRHNLPLSALSRVCVSVRNEGLYGSLVIASLLPRLATLIRQISTGHEVRLVSIAIRSSSKCISADILELYYDRISQLLKNGDLEELDPSIYCKILLCLNDTKWIHRWGKVEGGKSCQELQRAIGHLLAPKAKDLSLVDITSIQRILEYGSQEPPQLIDSLNLRIGRLIEEHGENPPLDLFSCLSPATRRSLQQRKRLAAFVIEYLQNYKDFWEIYPGLFKVIRALKLVDEDDTGKVYEKFWTKVTHLLTLESNDPFKVLKLAYDYLSFCSGSSFTARHIQFESKAKQLLYFYIYNYINQQQPTMISPSDFAKAYAFLLAYSWHAEPIFQEKSHGLWQLFQEKFLKGTKPLEALILARGISTSLNNQTRHTRCSSKYLDQIHNFEQSVEDMIESFLLNERSGELSVSELIFLTKAQSTLRKASTESSTFRKTIDIFSKRATVERFDSKEGRDLVISLSGNNYNDPNVTAFLINFIHTNSTAISPEFAQRFLSYAYHSGIEPQSPKDISAFQATYDVISSHWKTLSTFGLLQSSLMLSLAQCLQPPLVQHIFSAEFLNRLDEDVKSSSPNSSYPSKLRKLYMELNRAACLDLPSANVPWFHQKYCETVFATLPPYEVESALENEVETSLREVLNNETAIQTNVISPYFYNIDVVVEFDVSGKPVKKGKGRKLLSLPTLRRRSVDESPKVGHCVAILILPESAFATNRRSLRGFYLLRKRHLEILGYRVIHIDPQHWNAMHMTQVGRAEYLENKIFNYKQTSHPLKASPAPFHIVTSS